MRRIFLVFLISLSLGILETSIFPYSLALLWVICFSTVSLERESFYLSFLTGLFSDFLKGERFGRTALVFLSFSFLIGLYKRKFKVIHPLYFFPFVVLSVLIFDFLEFGQMSLLNTTYSLAVAVLLSKITQIFKPKEEKVELEV